MPNIDGTGPQGQGPMTGRRMGYCAGYNSPGFANAGFGRGRCFGRGFGRGRGFRARMMPIIAQPQVITEAEERNYLQEELKALKEEMQEIEKRIKEIK